ncbi:hypothetical protein HanOQP8_Chr03g0103551 [Helianthus annuus]|nr:hypothetical protein HanOQP8_Chr03g0103551 [Helianthus annuus]
MTNDAFISNGTSVVTRVMKMTNRISLSAKGCGVTIKGFAYLPEEANTAPVVDTKAAADEDDDSGVDLFGEETEEEKKAVEDHAAAVKAAGKKKECGEWNYLNIIPYWDTDDDSDCSMLLFNFIFSFNIEK